MEPPQPHRLLKVPKPTLGVEVLMMTNRQVIGHDVGVGNVVVEGATKNEVRSRIKIRSANPIGLAAIVLVVQLPVAERIRMFWKIHLTEIGAMMATGRTAKIHIHGAV